MTYPQQQGYAPQVQHVDPRYAQQYAPPQQQPAQQYGGPQGYPGAVVTYPQPPQQQPQAQTYAGPPQGQGIVPSTPQLRDGGGGGGSASPKLRHLVGRTIIVEPIRVDEAAVDPQTKAARPEAYFHLTVVDGGPLQYGDNQDRDPQKQRPNTHEIDTPCRFLNINDYGQAFVRAVRDALAAGEVGRVGIVQYGTRGNKPPMITKTSTDVHGNARPDGEARYAVAMQIFDLVWKDSHDKSGGPRRFVSPEPRSLVVAPAQAQAQVAYGAPQQQPYQTPAPAGYAQQQYQQTGTVPTPYGAAPAQQLHPEYVAAATQPTYNPYAAPPAQYPQGTGPGGYHMGSGEPAAVPQYVAAPNEPALPPPVEAWLASLPEAQRAASRAAYIAQQQGQNGAQAPAQPTGPGM